MAKQERRQVAEVRAASTLTMQGRCTGREDNKDNVLSHKVTSRAGIGRARGCIEEPNEGGEETRRAAGGIRRKGTEERGVAVQRDPVTGGADTGRKSMETLAKQRGPVTGRKSTETSETPGGSVTGRKSIEASETPRGPVTGRKSIDISETPRGPVTGRKSIETSETPRGPVTGRKSIETPETPRGPVTGRKSIEATETLRGPVTNGGAFSIRNSKGLGNNETSAKEEEVKTASMKNAKMPEESSTSAQGDTIRRRTKPLDGVEATFTGDRVTKGHIRRSLSEGGAALTGVSKGPRAGRGRRSTTLPEDLETSAPQVVSSAGTRSSQLPGEDVSSSDINKRLKKAANELRLKMSDISKAAEQVNTIVDELLHSKFIQKDPIFKNLKRMPSGSYYEKVKISKPNEFDIMLKLNVGRLQLTEYDNSGCYYTLQPKRLGKNNPLHDYIDEENNISASKMLLTLRKFIKDDIKNSGKEITVERKKNDSPAITILIGDKEQDVISVDLVLALEVSTSWPCNTKDGLKIEGWLGTKDKKKLKYTPIYFVPKQTQEARKARAEIWRISFSHVEKHMLTNHGSTKTCCEKEGETCCRKQCLKLLKYILNQLKDRHPRKMNQFCSYHAKTALLHSCVKWSIDEQWKIEDLHSCFERYIQYFQACLKDAELPNFFIPGHNLFDFDRDNLTFLYNEIEIQKRDGYKIFYNLLNNKDM
ncbi:cyclic GMP-AMP synthase [Discoglossus pictus]